MDILRFLALVGLIQGVFLFFGILGRGWKKALNYHLALLALIIALRLLPASFPNLSQLAPPSIYWSFLESLIFLIGPLMWFYTRNLVGKPTLGNVIIHFIPAIGLLFTALIPQGQLRTQIFIVSSIIVYPHIGGYQVFMLYELRRFSQKAKDYVSNPEVVRLTWLRAMLIGSIAVLLVNMVADLISIIYRPPFLFVILNILVADLYLFGIAYLTIRYPESNQEINETREQITNQMIDAGEDNRYAKNRLGDLMERKILQSLVDHMRESEHFRDDELRLSDLADVLGYPEHTISMVLNIHQRENFYQFVNRYRIEAAKNALADPNKSSKSILEIAYDSGFRSKSTFNTLFRDFTGKTPSKFRSG